MHSSELKRAGGSWALLAGGFQTQLHKGSKCYHPFWEAELVSAHSMSQATAEQQVQ